MQPHAIPSPHIHVASDVPASARPFPEDSECVALRPDGTPCGAPLDLSQPDQSRPELMLGVCTDRDCGAWCVVRTVRQTPVLLLPARTA